MPAKSERQQRAAGTALRAKRRGSSAGLGGSSLRMYRNMSESQLRDYAKSRSSRSRKRTKKKRKKKRKYTRTGTHNRRKRRRSKRRRARTNR